MIDVLKYGFDDSRICLDIPQDIFELAMDSSELLTQIVDAPANKRVVNTEANDGGTRLSLNTKRAGNSQDRYIKEFKCRDMVQALAEVATFTPRRKHDPALQVALGTERINNDDRFGMSAKLRWPSRSNSELRSIATQAMQQTALELHYVSQTILPDMVYAQIDRQRGVTLETNPVGSCSMDTDGGTYEADDPSMKLYAHNIYNHEMQLICLSGLISIARA